MKIDREKVYDKYEGHCAYCGIEISIKDMQVDHLIPKKDLGNDNIDNLMPSCKICNHYKRAWSLEYFRYLLGAMEKDLRAMYKFKVATIYDMVEEKNSWDGKFYFER